MITIVLIEPENVGNIGAIARAMANFGLKNLVIINPKCDVLCKTSMDRAVHAKDILKKATITDETILQKFDYKIATTGILGTDYNIPRSPLSPKDLGKKLSAVKNRNIAILFGREGIGLKNSEIEQCDFIVTIGTSKKYTVMNLSHAAAIIFYELYAQTNEEKNTDHITPASKKDKEVFLKELEKTLANMKFSTKEKKETQMTVWKRLIGKSMLTKREIFALFGFLRKIK